MSLLDNVFVVALLNDMLDVGIKKWGGMTALVALVTYGLWGTSIIPYGALIGVVFTLNLAFATGVTIYWKYRGRRKHGFTSVMDIAEAKRGRQ